MDDTTNNLPESCGLRICVDITLPLGEPSAPVISHLQATRNLTEQDVFITSELPIDNATFVANWCRRQHPQVVSHTYTVAMEAWQANQMSNTVSLQALGKLLGEPVIPLGALEDLHDQVKEGLTRRDQLAQVLHHLHRICADLGLGVAPPPAQASLQNDPDAALERSTGALVSSPRSTEDVLTTVLASLTDVPESIDDDRFPFGELMAAFNEGTDNILYPS